MGAAAEHSRRLRTAALGRERGSDEEPEADQRHCEDRATEAVVATPVDDDAGDHERAADQEDEDSDSYPAHGAVSVRPPHARRYSVRDFSQIPERGCQVNEAGVLPFSGSRRSCAACFRHACRASSASRALKPSGWTAYIS